MSDLGGLHAGGGLLLLALGAYLMLAPKRGATHRVGGELYFWLLAGTCVSALVIGARHPGLSVFEVVTPITFGYGLLGYVAGKMRPFRWRDRSWLYWHLLGQGGSYIGVVTAFGLQVAPRILPPSLLLVVLLAIVPAVVGSRLMGRTAKRWLGPISGDPVGRPDA
jgi:hypothetical protein